MEESYNSELINETLFHLTGIVVYRNIKKDEIFKKYSELIHLLSRYSNLKDNAGIEQILNSYYEVLSMLIERYNADEQLTGDLWKNHVIQLVISDENSFTAGTL